MKKRRECAIETYELVTTIIDKYFNEHDMMCLKEYLISALR